MKQKPPLDPCAPEAKRCEPPIERTLFSPGISTRHSPHCDGDLCFLTYCGGGNWRLTNRGTLDRTKWIEGWAITQLFTRGEVSCEEHPLKKRDGGWWADSFRIDTQFKSGSKLWSMNWHRVDSQTLLTAKHYAAEALQYLIAWGIASKIEITPLWASVKPAMIHLRILIRGPGNVAVSITARGVAMPNSTFLWDEYRPGLDHARAA